MGGNYCRKFIFILTSVFLITPFCYADHVEEQHINVALRMIGHQLLLETGDSTSRVLPIEKQDGKYHIQFENELAFEPDVLVGIVNDVVQETQIARSYIVEVKKCASEEIVHSFEKRILEEYDVIPCKSRALPKACYQVFFTITEEGTTPIKAKQDIPITGQKNLYPFILAIIVIGVMVYLKKKKSSQKSHPDWIAIGEYQFDKKGMKLIYKGKNEELSSKESDLLDLLYSNENQTLEREYILNIVWGDEGDYVGRTLDVFISRLRKKLENDPTLKIINIRGIGYRFVMNS